MHIQQITRKHNIVNKTTAGQVLRRFFHSPKAMSHLDQWQCGWLDGGCWLLAQALASWITRESTIRHVYRPDTGISEHAVCHIPRLDIYIDGDGICTKQEMMDKMHIIEDFDSPLDIRDTTQDCNDPKDIWQQPAKDLAKLIKNSLGSWKEFSDKHDLPRQVAHIRAATFKFLTTCDNFRKTRQGESDWQYMIAKSRRISKRAFASKCSISDMLEEGESWLTWGSGDPGTSFYVSLFPNGSPCCYAQYAGFEFIFAPSKN